VFRIKKDDLVEVRKGRERGKRGRIRQILPDENRAIITDVNIMKKHVRQGSTQARQAGIIDIEAPIQLANLALVCKECGKATRVGYRNLENGQKARFCKTCGELT
jgi:large subunit ribosomal protein L24